MIARLEWKPQDCWVGVFWKVTRGPFSDSRPLVEAWVCLLPMLPLHVSWSRRR